MYMLAVVGLRLDVKGQAGLYMGGGAWIFSYVSIWIDSKSIVWDSSCTI